MGFAINKLVNKIWCVIACSLFVLSDTEAQDRCRGLMAHVYEQSEDFLVSESAFVSQDAVALVKGRDHVYVSLPIVEDGSNIPSDYEMFRFEFSGENPMVTRLAKATDFLLTPIAFKFKNIDGVGYSFVLIGRDSLDRGAVMHFDSKTQKTRSLLLHEEDVPDRPVAIQFSEDGKRFSFVAGNERKTRIPSRFRNLVFNLK